MLELPALEDASRPVAEHPSAGARAAVGLLVAVLALAMRWAAASRGADNVDSIYFARALDRYSLVGLSPYFPGFPLYIAASRLARWLVADRYLALHLVSAIASALCAWPISRIAADWCLWAGGNARAAHRSALAAALLWAVSPAACLTGTEIASDPLALLLGLLMFWCAGRVVQGSGGGWPVATGVTAGLMLGVRLFHVFLLGPALTAWWAARRQSRPAVRAGVAIGLAAGILPWLGWQAWHEGEGLVRAARAQVSVHLQAPEHSLASDPAPLRRAGEFVATVYVKGLGFWTPRAPGAAARAGLTVALGALLGMGVRRMRAAPSGVRWLPALWAVPFMLYVVAGQDVTYTRYTLPLAAAAILLAALGVERRGGTIALLMASVAAAAVTLGLAPEHRMVEPTEFQLARALDRRHPSGAALLILDNERMMTAIVQAHAPGVRPVWAAPAQIGPLTAALEAEGLAVYSTMPASDAPNRWRPVERFLRRSYHDVHSAPEIWLFRHEGGDRPSAPHSLP